MIIGDVYMTYNAYVCQCLNDVYRLLQDSFRITTHNNSSNDGYDHRDPDHEHYHGHANDHDGEINEQPVRAPMTISNSWAITF